MQAGSKITHGVLVDGTATVAIDGTRRPTAL
jgi:hypothetical protein